MPRGKKSCPECHGMCGPRLRICTCGHEFAFKQKVKSRPPVQLSPRIPPKIPAKVTLRSDDTTPSNDPPKVIVVIDRDEVQEFLQQLKSCYDRSHHNGGGYSAFLHHKTGTLQVDVCLKMRLP